MTKENGHTEETGEISGGSDCGAQEILALEGRERRYDFARAMARSVFGRHHLYAEAEKRFREAMTRKPPQHRNRP